MAASRRQNLSLFRGIVREIRLAYGKKPAREKQPYQFVVDQFKRYHVTQKKYCRGQNEVQHMATTYLCLLQSIRKQQELSNMYKGKGERTIEDSAKLVGLGLPKHNDQDLTT